MVDCHGQGDPELAGQHLALFQVQLGEKNSYVLLVFCGQMFSRFATKSRVTVALEVISAINLFFFEAHIPVKRIPLQCV